MCTTETLCGALVKGVYHRNTLWAFSESDPARNMLETGLMTLSSPPPSPSPSYSHPYSLPPPPPPHLPFPYLPCCCHPWYISGMDLPLHSLSPRCTIFPGHRLLASAPKPFICPYLPPQQTPPPPTPPPPPQQTPPSPTTALLHYIPPERLAPCSVCCTLHTPTGYDSW